MNNNWDDENDRFDGSFRTDPIGYLFIVLIEMYWVLYTVIGSFICFLYDFISGFLRRK